jgi:anti-sigma regulatory factor (Ser/Thr protein kinase)
MPGGRGVFLMRRLVDRLEFLPPGNRVRLVVFARR